MTVNNKNWVTYETLTFAISEKVWFDDYCYKTKHHSQLPDTFISSTRPLMPFSSICRQPAHMITQLQIFDFQLHHATITH